MNSYSASETLVKKQALTRGKKLVLIVFVIWFAQAVPKWSAAIMADDETSAKIVGFFITPMSETLHAPASAPTPAQTQAQTAVAHNQIDIDPAC